MRNLRRAASRLAAALVAVSILGGCGGARTSTLTITTTVAAPGTPTPPLPGTGRPAVTIGDKNLTEQFVLGELYYEALRAQGYTATLNRNIGPTEVTMQALQAGTLSMYPEYLSSWDTAVAGYRRHFPSALAAFHAGQSWALNHGYELLNPTPFSDTPALAVNFNYGVQKGLSSIGDLVKVEPGLTLGGPPQFEHDPDGLPAITRAYGVVPAAFKPLGIGEQYQALDAGTVQAADVDTTDGPLITGNYTLLSDPLKVFGWGNVVPVVPLKVIEAEGPQFAATINRVSALLTLTVIRQMNAAVAGGADPATVALRFLVAHGLVPAGQQP
ncbi:MAG TPA: glycine betaine ABC transporter substrate-binding protein [Solirubrobacteraceae bacterium]|nr:glycine betaine ABC transporter substrate-binding protein [Solirubrobacteraceae bacterium]